MPRPLVTPYEHAFRSVEDAAGLPYGSIRRRWDDESPTETAERNVRGLQRLLAALAPPFSLKPDPDEPSAWLARALPGKASYEFCEGPAAPDLS